MHFLLIQLFLIIFYQKVFASIYDNPCTTTCNFSGMICVSGRCKCDSKSRLFWTGARCLSCPHDWAMSEVRCIGYYGTKMSWPNAQAICQQIQGDLISLHDNSILPLIYQVTGGKTRRKKQVEIATDATVAWTSAHAIQLTNLGLYQWNDNSLGTFDSRHLWWCKIGIPDLGYYHPYQEPTRLIYDNDEEKCVLFRRGTGSVPMLCLDDVFCNEEYPFVCERSESTAQKFIGPAPFDGGNKPSSSSSNIKPTTRSSSYASSAGGYIDVNNEHLSPMAANSNASKSNKNTKILIIILVIGLLLLAGVLTGIFFFIKHRNKTGTQFQIGDNNIKGNQVSNNVQPSIKKVANTSDISDVDEIPPQRTSTDEPGLTLGTDLHPENMNINIGKQNQQKNRRGGYSKQQFDEFE